MQVIPYLIFNGQCEAAFEFYKHCLGATIGELHRYEGSPMAEQVPPASRKLIMHGCINIDGQMVMASDRTPDQPYEGIKGISLSIGVDDPVEAERIFQALAENGTVQMPIAQTFWALRFGMLVDQFGTPWMVNCDQPPIAA